MSVIFLSENNALNKKVLKSPFPAKPVATFEIPYKKMKKRATFAFRQRLNESDSLFFANPPLDLLIPEKEADCKVLFDSVIINILYNKLSVQTFPQKRLVIYNPNEILIKSALSLFSDIALSGKGALLLSNRIYELTGASLPIVSGCSEGDIAICTKDCLPLASPFVCGFDLETSEKSLGGNSLKFYPKAEYSEITVLMNRSLTLKEAALLSEYDEKATFNIAF